MIIDWSIQGATGTVGYLREMADRAMDARPATRIIRDLVIEGHKRQFESQGSFLGTPWQALSPATLRRKARRGLPAEALVSSGAIQTALAGGAGRKASATRSSAIVGVNPQLFYLRFLHGGASGGRRGVLPARALIGVNDAERFTIDSIIVNFLERGSLA